VYRNAAVRIGIVLACGLLAAHSPPLWGFPFVVDGWLWRGVRDVATAHVRDLPLFVAAAMVVADIAGRWCPSTAFSVRQPRRWVIAVVAVAGLALWLLRVRHWFGDLEGIDRDELPWWRIETAEPLGAYTFYYIMHGAAALSVRYSTALALVTTALGATAVGAMFLWSRLVAAEWPLVFAMFLSSGFMVLLCGYPEKGTPKALALVCWYVYFATRALRERRAATQFWSGLFLSLAALMHGSALCWLPAHAWYVWRPARWRQAVIGIASFLVPILIMFAYAASGAPRAGGTWGNTTAQLFWFKRYCVTNCGYDFWSLSHGLDVLNCLLVLAPVALLCFPEALVRSRNETERWLALGSLGWLFLSATWFPVYGYLSDWDIFAATPLILTYHGALVSSNQLAPAHFRRLALLWIVGSLLHAASWWRFFHVPL
jgi:hypothetical protein